jgi:predicted RNA-binding Zn-ribbon protein involved in translation (DUF1610 family)
MEKIKCIKCNNEVKIDISKAIDEDGETFVCPNCGQKFRYTNK